LSRHGRSGARLRADLCISYENTAWPSATPPRGTSHTWIAQDACRGWYADAEKPRVFIPEDAAGRLSREEIDALEALLNRCRSELTSPSMLHGFFSAVVSGPPVMPSEWLPIVFGDVEWQTPEDLQTGLAIAMRAYNSVAHELLTNPETFAILMELGDDGDGALELAAGWCCGFVRGMAMRPDDWPPLMHLEPIGVALHIILAIASPDKDDMLARALFADSKLAAGALDSLGPAVADIYAYWRSGAAGSEPIRRAEPKIGRNDPCPCGSGKKYKRCCSPLRAV